MYDRRIVYYYSLQFCTMYIVYIIVNDSKICFLNAFMLEKLRKIHCTGILNNRRVYH